MLLNRLAIKHFRNFSEVEWEFPTLWTAFVGPNGSGKTSVLEAIYFLSSGRSFRASLLEHLIQHQAEKFTLFAEGEAREGKYQVGLSRSRLGAAKSLLNGKAITSNAELARCLPAILFNPESFALLSGGAKARRQLLDFGVFHHYPEFYSVWQEARRAVLQRNALLKQPLQPSILASWDRLLEQAAQQIDKLRSQYMEALFPVLNTLLTEFLPQFSVQISYYRGWSKESQLGEVLQSSVLQDRKAGHTHYGPHRADVRFKVNGLNAETVLSRGQQKLLICAVKIAQGQVYQHLMGRPCIYLLDDLVSELDELARKRLVDCLQGLSAQLFLTANDEMFVRAFPSAQMRVNYLSFPSKTC